MKAIEEHNEVCRLITEIGAYRKLANPTITGYEFQCIQLVSLVCPKYLILPYLRETAKEMKTRKPDSKPTWRCKVVLYGSENDDPEFTKLIESCGALVVADRHCYGSLPGREEIVVADGQSPLDAITRHYLDTSMILVLTSLGYGKMSYAKDTDLPDGRHYDGYRLTKRGAKGVTTVKVTPKNGKLVAVRAVEGDEDLLVITQQGIVIRTPLSEVKIAGRNTQGVKVIALEDKQRVASISIVPHDGEVSIGSAIVRGGSDGQGLTELIVPAECDVGWPSS